MLASLLYLKNCKFGSVFRKASFFQRETTSSTCLQHSLWRYNTGLAYVLFNYPSAMKQHNTSPFVGQYKSHNYSDRWTCSDGWKQRLNSLPTPRQAPRQQRAVPCSDHLPCDLGSSIAAKRRRNIYFQIQENVGYQPVVKFCCAEVCKTLLA